LDDKIQGQEGNSPDW